MEPPTADSEPILWSSERGMQLAEAQLELRLSPHPDVDVARVNQLDAVMLDSELNSLLRSQWSRVAKHLPQHSALFARLQPEVDASFRLLVWIFTMRLNLPAPGDELQNLRYRNEAMFHAAHTRGLMSIPGDSPTRLQRLLHCALTVLAPWLLERLKLISTRWSWAERSDGDLRREADRIIRLVERVSPVLAVLNMVAFLSNGRYRSIVDRVLQLRLVYDRKEAVRSVSFDFINQQLLYDGFAEMLMCILPLVDRDAVWRFASRFWVTVQALYALARRKLQRLRGRDDLGANEKGRGTQGDLDMDATLTPPLVCTLCGADPPTIPLQANCGHIFCYFCLKTSCMRDTKLTCLACGTAVVSSERFLARE